jgi:predicted nucleic acid-binding protein
MKVFVDTGAFCALTVPTDMWHDAALRALKRIREAKALIFTSNFILAETYTLINVRAGRLASLSFMDRNERSGIDILRVTEETETTACAIFRKYDLPRLSFTDCTSFALIKTHRIDHVFTFDEHFRMFRFNHPVTLLGRILN